jgi:hypothetical protein
LHSFSSMFFLFLSILSTFFMLFLILMMFKFSSFFLSDGEIWTAHGGANPSGLVVRWGGI